MKLGTLFVRIRDNYGKPAVYPDCEQSKLLAELAGTATLTPRALALIRAIGFDIAESAESCKQRTEVLA